jgi:hypothetical protein
MLKKKKINRKDYELVVNLSYKVKGGSIKVSEKDLGNLGMGVVEDVIVTQVGKKEGIQLMLFSDSHIKAGNSILNVKDANELGLEEGDKIIVKRAVSYQNIGKVSKKKDDTKITNIGKEKSKEDSKAKLTV